jgi:hypothetical protein
MSTAHDQVAEHVSAAFRAENVAFYGSQEELERIAAAGPRGALTLAGLAVAVVLAIWVAFFVLVFLPRGAIG